MSYKQIPDFVLELMMSGALSKTDMRVYAVLLSHTSSNRGPKGRIVWPGYRTIHDRLGAQVSNASVSISIKRIEPDVKNQSESAQERPDWMAAYTDDDRDDRS